MSPISSQGGTYNPDTGITHEGNCTQCPISYYCPEASITPVICPKGFFCPVVGMTSGNENPCPAGFYSNTEGLNGK